MEQGFNEFTLPEERGLAASRQRRVSFDGGHACEAVVVQPDRYRHIEALPVGIRRIAAGGGYSYAAASFGGGALVVDMTRFDRVLSLDEREGAIECEGGTPLGKIFRVAAPRGFYLAVQPGYPGITVGGCIAADVHGKNPSKDGTFRSVLLELTLLHPEKGLLRCSPDTNPDLFELTCGGLGLTGCIMSAKVRLSRCPSSRVIMRRIRISSLEEACSKLKEHAPRVSFLYSWHNFTARGKRFGSGFIYTGEFSDGGSREALASGPWSRVDAASRGAYPFALLRPSTARVFNDAYQTYQEMTPSRAEVPLFSFLFPVANKVIYFRLYGRSGFHEVQLLVPWEAVPELCRRLRGLFGSSEHPVTLASMKAFNGAPRYTRFSGEGLCVGLDFPRGPGSGAVLSSLDRLAMELGAIPNVVKDSRLPSAVAEAAHPGLRDFREALRTFDPRRRFVSELSTRLKL